MKTEEYLKELKRNYDKNDIEPDVFGQVKYCPDCGRRMKPCPSKTDGEFTFRGYYPCSCKKKGLWD